MNTKAAVDAAVNRSVLLPPTVEPAVITVEDLPATVNSCPTPLLVSSHSRIQDIPDNNPIGVVVTFQVAPAFTVEVRQRVSNLFPFRISNACVPSTLS